MKESFIAVSTTPAAPSGSNVSMIRDDSSDLTIVLTAPDDICYHIQFPRRLAADGRR